MKQFFKFFFASVLGTFVTAIILFFIMMGIFMSVISYSKKETVDVKSNTILRIKLNEPVMDRTPVNPFTNTNFFNLKTSIPPGLNDILANIKKAKNDKRIKGILLDLSYIPAGIATIEEIRDALVDFKMSDKFIVCYGDFYSQTAYYLGSVADEMYLNPEGLILFKGINAEIVYLKGLLDQLGIEAQVFRNGKYKSAVEPLLRESMSDANREQLNGLFNSIWDRLLIDISKSRNISIYDLNLIANNLELFDAENATKNNFVDDLIYKDHLIKKLREKTGISKDKKLNIISMSNYTYAKDKSATDNISRDYIAVIYGEGDIVMGEGKDLQIGAEKYAKALREARKDKNVKAIVFRVNSPGGNALASEIVRREVELAANEKPFVVSMGDLAASGGYWISCNADKILADETTITGSIGVYGIFPNIREFLNDKLEITTDNVMTNENANLLSMSKPLTDYQKTVIQEQIDREYRNFLKLVTQGRNMRVTQVDSIAQGRVWSGLDAIRIGLIDEFGGLSKSIETAAGMANIKSYKLRELPIQKDPIEELINSLFGTSHASAFLEEELGDSYKYYEYYKKATQIKGIQARMPFFLEIE